jgi:uncharacterized membrane protein
MDRRPLATGIAVAVVLLAVAALLKLAQHSALIGADTAARATQAVIGLMVAFYGNFIPKTLGRARSVEAERRVQRALHVSGWAFTLAGLAYAALALFAPSPIAWTGSITVMAAAIVISLGYGIWRFAACDPGCSSAE